MPDAMPISRTALATLLALGLWACAGPSRETVLDSFVGQDVEIAVEEFGKPAQVVTLDEGRYVYIWRRVYSYDVNRRADSWPERRLQGWESDPDKPVKARVCLTSLYVGFDFIVERWDYGCHTEVEESGYRARHPSE